MTFWADESQSQHWHIWWTGDPLLPTVPTLTLSFVISVWACTLRRLWQLVFRPFMNWSGTDVFATALIKAWHSSCERVSNLGRLTIFKDAFIKLVLCLLTIISAGRKRMRKIHYMKYKMSRVRFCSFLCWKTEQYTV